MTLWEILKANKTGIAPDMFTMLAASKMNGGRDRLHELTGTPPLSFKSKGKPLTAWSITGNTVQNGTPTPDNPIMPQGTGEKTAQLFDYQTGTPTAYKYLDENGTENEVSEIAPWYITDYIPIPDGVLSVTLSKIGGGSPAMCAYDASKNYITGIKYDTGSAVTKVDITLTSSTPIRFIRFSYFLGNTGYDDISTKMLNTGSTALPYEPYGYKIPVVTRADGAEPITTPIYLPTPLYSGEVMRSDGSREVKWGKIVLTGEEKIAFVGTAGTSYRYDFVNIKTISQIKYARKNSKITHFKQCDMPTIDVVGYDWHGSSFYLMIMTTQSTINKFKDWLKSQYEAGTPVTVWYQLATPTTETVTVPQIPTINGTTVIDVDTAVKPESMTIKYRR